MKIAVSADCFASYTSGFPVRGMMYELIRRNPDINFQLYYTRRNWSAELREFYDEINSLENVEVKFFADSQKVIAIKRLLRLKYVSFDRDVDLFLSPGNPEYIKGYEGASICSLADLSTIKGISTNKYRLFFKYWVKFQWRRTLPWTTTIVAISDYTKKDIIKYFPDIQGKVTTIHNGIGNHWFNQKSTSYCAEKFGIYEPYFIWWGYVSRRKNIDRLIQAYKMAKSQYASLPKLLLVGSISDHMKYIQKDFDENIINIGFQNQDNLQSLVAESRGLVFPSLYEGFGLPVVEAFSQGVNVACSNVTSLPEVSGGHALLFDPNSVEEIAESLIKLATAPMQKEKLKNYAKQYSYTNAALEYLNLIRNILQ